MADPATATATAATAALTLAEVSQIINWSKDGVSFFIQGVKHGAKLIRKATRVKYAIDIKDEELCDVIITELAKHITVLKNELKIQNGVRRFIPAHGTYLVNQNNRPIWIRHNKKGIRIYMVVNLAAQMVVGNGGIMRRIKRNIFRIVAPFKDPPKAPEEGEEKTKKAKPTKEKTKKEKNAKAEKAKPAKLTKAEIKKDKADKAEAVKAKAAKIETDKADMMKFRLEQESLYMRYLRNVVNQFQTSQEKAKIAAAANPEVIDLSKPKPVTYYTSNKEDEWCFSKQTTPLYNKDKISKAGHDFLADVKVFIEDEMGYAARGESYNRKYLLHGGTGQGKTTVARIAASIHGMAIYTVHISSSDINSRTFRLIMDSAGEQQGYGQKFIVLMDEIDKCVANIKNGICKKLAPSDLLTALDGSCSLRHGAIVIMTANDINFVNDPAFLDTKGDSTFGRPGRVDAEFEF